MDAEPTRPLANIEKGVIIDDPGGHLESHPGAEIMGQTDIDRTMFKKGSHVPKPNPSTPQSQPLSAGPDGFPGRPSKKCTCSLCAFKLEKVYAIMG